jgi:hypothetical protein
VRGLRSTTLAVMVIVLDGICYAQIPVTYQDLYTQLNRDIADFQGAVRSSWNGATFPVAFSGQLTDANCNNGPNLLQPSSFTLIENEILLLKAIGVKAISVEYFREETPCR